MRLALLSYWYGLVLISVVSGVLGSGGHCQPTFEHLNRLGRWISYRNDSHVHTAFHPAGLPIRTRLDDSSDDSAIPLAGGDLCETSDDFGLSGFAVCPFHWRLNTNPHRIPSELPEVRCNCKLPLTGGMSTGYRCQELYYKVKVIRLGPNCDATEDSEETVAFACVPIRPRQMDVSNANRVSVADSIQVEAKRGYDRTPSSHFRGFRLAYLGKK